MAHASVQTYIRLASIGTQGFPCELQASGWPIKFAWLAAEDPGLAARRRRRRVLERRNLRVGPADEPLQEVGRHAFCRVGSSGGLAQACFR